MERSLIAMGVLIWWTGEWTILNTQAQNLLSVDPDQLHRDIRPAVTGQLAVRDKRGAGDRSWSGRLGVARRSALLRR